jgi:STE24 endopeptidase
MNFILIITMALILAKLAATLALSALNRAEVRRHASAPPAAATAVMDAATYNRSVSYTLAKSRFGAIEDTADAIILALALFSGVLPALHGRVAGWGAPGAAWTGALFILAAVGLISIPSLGFDWWEKFRVEAKFDFNRSTTGLWLADRLKGLAVAIVLGFPLLWALLLLVGRAGSAWWLWGFALVFGFQLAMLVLHPKLILPLFNKLAPLSDDVLRSRLLALGERTGFRAAAIQVMDGGKRSAHSNAFFTGFGRFRRIVLFDTLVAQLAPEELEAVLAHEIGHYRRGHVPRMMALSGAMLLGGFAVIAWLARSSWFNPAFGFHPGELAPSFLLFGLMSELVIFWMTPLGNLLSRQYEYEADAFARTAMDGPGPMVGALRKLTRENLGNLTPHPWFSAFFHSHPTLIEREQALTR